MADRSSADLDFTRRSDQRLRARSLRQRWPVEAILADAGSRDDLREPAGKLTPPLAGGPTTLGMSADLTEPAKVQAGGTGERIGRRAPFATHGPLR
jgi:hypothetical protein